MRNVSKNEPDGGSLQERNNVNRLAQHQANIVLQLDDGSVCFVVYCFLVSSVDPQQRMCDSRSFRLPVSTIRRKNSIAAKVLEVVVGWSLGCSGAVLYERWSLGVHDGGCRQDGSCRRRMCDVNDRRVPAVYCSVHAVRPFHSLHTRQNVGNGGAGQLV